MIVVTSTPKPNTPCEACGEVTDKNLLLKIKVAHQFHVNEFHVVVCERDRHDLDNKICRK